MYPDLSKYSGEKNVFITARIAGQNNKNETQQKLFCKASRGGTMTHDWMLVNLQKIKQIIIISSMFQSAE